MNALTQLKEVLQEQTGAEVLGLFAAGMWATQLARPKLLRFQINRMKKKLAKMKNKSTKTYKELEGRLKRREQALDRDLKSLRYNQKQKAKFKG